MRTERALTLAALAAAAALLCGCHQPYFARNEGVTFQAGDAVAANKAIHIIDPWPASAASARLDTSGVRAAAAIERYNTRIPDGATGPGAAGSGAGAGAPPAAKTAQ